MGRPKTKVMKIFQMIGAVMAWPKLEGERHCNTYVGVINLTWQNATSPYDVSGLGDQDSLCPPAAKAGCYTLLASDLDGDMLVQNGCHDGSLEFQKECMCLPGHGYACRDLCTEESDCNGKV